MKKIKFIQLFLVISIMVSCNEYLEDIPDTRTLVDSKEKVQELLTGAYPVGVYFAMAEYMSDNSGDKGLVDQVDELGLKMYSWDIPIASDQDRDTPIYYWNACYKAIAQANQALASIDELIESGQYTSQEFKNERGEALLARAYSHFMLVNLFAKHYDPATADSDLGIPYTTTPETELFKDYERSSVAEVYSNIENDLEEGLSLVGTNADFPKYHFSPKSAMAFAARFYLYKGEWDKVISYTNNLLPADPATVIRDWNQLRTLTYSELEAIYSEASYEPNLLVVYAHSLWARQFARNRFGLTNDKRLDLFNAGNPTGKSWSYPIYGNDQVLNIPKFREFFEYTNLSAQIGLPFTPMVLFSYDEALLMRAEALAMTESYTLALEDINSFLSKKTLNYSSFTDELEIDDISSAYPFIENEYTPYYSLTPTQSSFVKAISELKRRDYYYEGTRWFDIKRFNLVIEHSFVGGNTITLEKDDLRRQVQIPQTVIANGIQANPR